MALLDRVDLEVTPIVAYGGVLLLCVIAWLGLERFSQVEKSMAAQVVAAHTELATLESLSGAEEWEGRLEAAMARRVQVRSGIWTGTTTGVIAANLQQELRKIGANLEYKHIRARADPEIVDVEGINVLSFEFAGQAKSGKGVADLLEALAKSDKTIIIQEVEFAQNLRDRRPPRLAFSGIIPIEVVTATQTNPATAQGAGG